MKDKKVKKKIRRVSRSKKGKSEKRNTWKRKSEEAETGKQRENDAFQWRKKT